MYDRLVSRALERSPEQGGQVGWVGPTTRDSCAVLTFCLLGLLVGYLAFRTFVQVDTECAGFSQACGSTDTSTRWTVVGGGVGFAVGLLASQTPLGPKTPRALPR